MDELGRQQSSMPDAGEAAGADEEMKIEVK